MIFLLHLPSYLLYALPKPFSIIMNFVSQAQHGAGERLQEALFGDSVRKVLENEKEKSLSNSSLPLCPGGLCWTTFERSLVTIN